MLCFFLVNLLPSVRLKPREKESIKPLAQLDDLILIERWQLGVAMQLQLNPSGSVQSKYPERVEVCGHSSSPFSQSMQGPKLGRGSLTDFQ